MKRFFYTIWNYVKRKWWYLILLGISSWLVYQNRASIFSLEFEKFNALTLIFILWIVLLLLPLFSEMEFFGVKLKKEVEKATNEVKESITDLKMQLIQLQVSNSVANTIQFGGNVLPSEGKLEELLQLVRGLQQGAPKDAMDVPNKLDEDEDKSVYLFKVRLGIETALSELAEKLGYSEKMPMMKMVQVLYRGEVIDGVTSDLISQAVKIANRGVHGEIVSDEYIDFMKQTYPEIQRQLKEALTKLHYTVCPKCKYKGYSRYENVCPQCGYTHDDE